MGNKGMGMTLNSMGGMGKGGMNADMANLMSMLQPMMSGGMGKKKKFQPKSSGGGGGSIKTPFSGGILGQKV